MTKADPLTPRRRRAPHAKWILPLAALLMVISGTTVIPFVAASASSSNDFGPIPAGLPIESRCQSMTVGSHIVFQGDRVEGRTGGGICAAVGNAPGDISWSWQLNGQRGVKGCKQNDTSCSFIAGASTNHAYGSLCISGSSVQGGWESCDYYAVVGDGQGVLDGYVKDKDGGPVAGTTIKAYGHPGATTTSGADGFYAMTLDKGSYQVEPEGGPSGKSSPSYTPKVAAVSVSDGSKSKADFTLDTSMELKLKLDQTSVSANGQQVINGTVTTTQYGKPLPNTKFQLEVDPTGTYDQAVSGGARASICYNGSRIWPTGTLSSPLGIPIDETTDANGLFTFSITVGTTPGTWTLDAWAFDSTGLKLSSDVSASSDTQSVSVAATSGKATLGGFVGELDTAAKAQAFSASLTSNASGAYQMVNLLSAATTTGGINFGGLDFGMTNAKDGQTMIIFPEDKPPVVNSAGVIDPSSPDNAGDLVYDPAEWTGAGLPSFIKNPTNLVAVVASGQLVGLPTLAQFDSGASIHGWKTVKGDQLTLFSSNFEYLGWGYPSSTAGACY